MANSDLTEGNDMVKRFRSLTETKGAGQLVELKYADMIDFMEDLGVKRQGYSLRK
eukprot:CAMPEP_0194326318 /NCGR_PEP_ID=MMETSP0171-20130528/36028_1 /TAXON_ID=218684 /ORGANISM="Corethron pennatum, Strain L29A3" /LENGTH=54 /DNA_ID=CAMNT_0039085861 /DNA_START=88 /DNA_END=250 /DNA_ORIENTATION=+